MRRRSLELPPPLVLCLSQMMDWQGFSKRGPQTSQKYEWEMGQSQANVSLSALCHLIQHLDRLLVWPFFVPPKPTSVSPFCALETLYCSSSSPGLHAVSVPAALAHRAAGWTAVIAVTLSWEDVWQGQHSNSPGRLQRGFAQIVGEGSKIFLCLFFSPWAFPGKKFHLFCYTLGQHSCMLSV